MAGSGFRIVLYVSLHNLFHQAEQQERKLLVSECFQQDFNIGEYRQKKLLDSKMQLFVIFSSEEIGLRSFI